MYVCHQDNFKSHWFSHVWWLVVICVSSQLPQEPMKFKVINVRHFCIYRADVLCSIFKSATAFTVFVGIDFRISYLYDIFTKMCNEMFNMLKFKMYFSLSCASISGSSPNTTKTNTALQCKHFKPFLLYFASLFLMVKWIPHFKTCLSSQLLPQVQRIHPHPRKRLGAGRVRGVCARQAIPAQNQGPNSPQQEPGQHRPAGLKCEFKTASTAVMPSCVGVESVCVRPSVHKWDQLLHVVCQGSVCMHMWVYWKRFHWCVCACLFI